MRNEGLNRLAVILQRVNSIAKDIAIMTQEQGETLEKVVKKMEDTTENVVEG